MGDLARIVTERLEENTRLEFKRQVPESGKNDHLAKDVAAMANSDGGVIVYGIEEDEAGRAKALAPINLKGAAERVILIAQTFDEPLTVKNAKSIPSGRNGEQGFLVVEVPGSDRAPHLVNGLALGRSAKSNVALTRRQIGQLFARQTGFAQEFGLVSVRPGRALANIVREQYQVNLKTHVRRWLEISNDGESDIYEVHWTWLAEDIEGEIITPRTLRDPFPLSVLPHGVTVPILISVALGTNSDLRVQTSWKDSSDQDHSQVWPVTL